MSISGMMNIGLAGLSAADEALLVTSNNISNANTPGYTTEAPVFTTISNGSIATTGETGDGVEVSNISRMYDSFVTQQLNTESSNLAYWNNYQSGMSNVENVLNTASTSSISTAITTFYNDWQTISQDPSDTTPRTILIQDAGNLSADVNQAYSSLNSERSQLFTNSQSLTGTLNTDTAEIASLNAQIAGNPGALNLQDQRDSLIQQLNSIVKVSTFTDNSGMVSVLLGGTPLVEGAKSFNMSVNTDPSNNLKFYVAINTSAAPGTPDNPDVTSYISGGQLAANLALRDTTIPSYINQLNALAVNLSDTTNQLQKQGYGLDGQPGGNFFSSLSDLAKYTSVDSSAGVFTSPDEVFSTNGGSLSIKLGAGDTSPATVNIAAGSTLTDVANDINQAAGSKVTASVVDVGPATQFTINAANDNDTFRTDTGGVWNSYTVPPGTYTGSSLANEINSLGAGIHLTYNGNANDFSITSAGGAAGASQLDFTAANSIGSVLGFSGTPTIGAGLTGTVPPDYRLKIISNPDGNLGEVSVGVTTGDSAGSGLNLLATSTAITSTSVTDAASLDPDAQYRIDYVDASTYGSLSPSEQAGYQVETASGLTYVLTNSNNTVEINGAAVTIPTGTYTGPQLAAALQEQLNSPGGGNSQTATVTYNTTGSDTDKFTISNNSGFVINSNNDTINFTDNTTGQTCTATIANGTYATGSDLAAAMQTAFNAADPTAFDGSAGGSVTFAAGALNIASKDSLSINWGSSSSTAIPQEFGFTSAATDIPANGNVSGTTIGSAALNIDWSNSNTTAAGMFGFYSDDPSSSIPVGGSLTSDYAAGIYWRVQESDDGSTWTTLNPNTAYDPSDPSSVNESEVNLDPDSSGLSRTLEFQGIKVQIDGNLINSATNPNGETFGVQLDPNAAEDLSTIITDPNQVAASTDTWNINSSNSSVVFNVNGGPDITATIPQGTYTNDPGQPDDISAALTSAIQTAYQTATGSTLNDTLNIAFNPNTKQFNMTMPVGSDSINLLWSNTASTANQVYGFSSNTSVSEGTDSVSDNPASVYSNANQGVPGDNRNALAIANVANGNAFSGTTPVDFYSSLVSDVGVEAASANNNQTFESSLVTQLTQQQQQVSGVSMDQEASNLIMYQQLYQAAAKVITTAQSLITTLMDMVGGSAS